MVYKIIVLYSFINLGARAWGLTCVPLQSDSKLPPRVVLMVRRIHIQIHCSAGPKGGPEGHVPPRRGHECPKKKLFSCTAERKGGGTDD